MSGGIADNMTEIRKLKERVAALEGAASTKVLWTEENIAEIKRRLTALEGRRDARTKAEAEGVIESLQDQLNQSAIANQNLLDERAALSCDLKDVSDVLIEAAEDAGIEWEASSAAETAKDLVTHWDRAAFIAREKAAVLEKRPDDERDKALAKVREQYSRVKTDLDNANTKIKALVREAPFIAMEAKKAEAESYAEGNAGPGIGARVKTKIESLLDKLDVAADEK